MRASRLPWEWLWDKVKSEVKFAVWWFLGMMTVLALVLITDFIWRHWWR